MISVNNLTKSYGDVCALDHFNLQVEENELFGVIGPDGAGKTTFFRMLVSLLVPDQGSIRLSGKDPVRDYRAVRNMIGYMPGKFSLYEDLTVEENLSFFATVFGTTVKENYHLVREVFQQLEPFKKRPAGKLSGGMKQKLALSCALVHKPQLLVLDEPTTGVDAVSRNEFWNMLQKLKDAGITILVSTPYMDEASRCDRVALVQKGHLLEVATPQEVKNGFKGQLFGVSGENLYHLIQSCRDFEEVFSVYPFGRALHLVFKKGGDQRQALTSYLQSRGFSNFSIEEIKPGVEDRFMALMEDVDQTEDDK